MTLLSLGLWCQEISTYYKWSDLAELFCLACLVQKLILGFWFLSFFFEIFQHNDSSHIFVIMTTGQAFLLMNLKSKHAMDHTLPEIMVVYELNHLLKKCTNHTMVLQYVSFFQYLSEWFPSLIWVNTYLKFLVTKL